MADEWGGPIGVIGLGRMGGAIARRLIATGAAVVGHDIDEGRLRAFSDSGGRPAGSAADVARDAQIVLVLLPSASALVAATSGAMGLEAVVGADSLVVEMSTLAIDDKLIAHERLGALGATVLDAPISGTAIQAEVGDIVVYASGGPTGIDRARRALAPACREVLDVGAFGNGTRLKLLANHLVAIHIAAAGEVLAVARRSGLAIAEVVRLLGIGAGASRMLEVRGPMMADRRYEPASMTIELFGKDLRLIAEQAGSVGASVPMLEAAANVFQKASARGWSDLDTAVAHEISMAADAGPA
jgi:3-hydroxyisobutyrate dehydrogenase-like beta-hydroxyacid dehydrogenase